MPTMFPRSVAASLILFALASPVLAQELWINEFHYDNDGSDTGEFVEVVVSDSVATAPPDIDVVLYNGSNGTVYGTHSLDTFTATAPVAGYTIYSKPISDIQNGAPDGLALVQDSLVVLFLSYEGDFTATDGPASGMVSTDIGVSESSSPIGESLQLSGTGSSYIDFSWQPPATETAGAVNTNQSLELPAQIFADRFESP